MYHSSFDFNLVIENKKGIIFDSHQKIAVSTTKLMQTRICTKGYKIDDK